MEKLQIAKSNRRSPGRLKPAFCTKYTKQQYKDGCASAYVLGLMDGEEGRVVKPDLTGMYKWVRIQNIKAQRTRKGGRGGEAALSPHNVQIQGQSDDEWVTVLKCPDQDRALAFLEDLVVILARAESRKGGE